MKPKYDNIVLNIPHSSTIGLPAGWDNQDELMKAVNLWTDWHTDYIFSSKHPDVHAVIAQQSRFILDVERLIDDPMEKIGQGIIYTDFNGLHRTVTQEEKENLMQRYHHHLDILRSKINENTLLIDCHSFPSYMADVDICIGFNEDWSKPPISLLNFIQNYFKENGLSIGINYPFSNSISPETYCPYHSFMIELNKRIYLDETNFTCNENAARVKELINQLYHIIL